MFADRFFQNFLGKTARHIGAIESQTLIFMTEPYIHAVSGSDLDELLGDVALFIKAYFLVFS